MTPEVFSVGTRSWWLRPGAFRRELLFTITELFCVTFVEMAVVPRDKDKMSFLEAAHKSYLLGDRCVGGPILHAILCLSLKSACCPHSFPKDVSEVQN